MRYLLVLLLGFCLLDAGAQPMRVVLATRNLPIVIRPNRSDTIAVNLAGTTSVSRVSWNNWNNIPASAGQAFKATGLKYKTTGLPSTINVDSIFNSSIITSSAAPCTDSSLAPPTVFQYYPYTAGTVASNGAIYYFSGFDKTRTYDFIYLPGNGQTSVRTISSGEQSVTQGFSGTNCTEYIRLIGLTPDVNGKIEIRNRGTTATANVYMAGFYFVEH